ncbi:KEOPS complex subunit Pcc1 [Methanothermobacter sp.]|uniref:KEOPS complex subunit Pcc1 n=1 Tax=Methanothermobacter sp. TaxID=1884223 RepID=UPI002617AE58|nr:KEOPS complex subunit Pcc1 [Methanothermobacter sp.]MDI9618371.1 KEOPS complex subunit Pcc1 [Methanothermobacter sp.]
MIDLGLKRIQGSIDISMGNPESASVVYRAVNPEFMDSPSDRSSVSVDLEDDRITIKISARDTASFRAALNSSFRWVRLSLDMIELVTPDQQDS